jgi:hypothetical protein
MIGECLVDGSCSCCVDMSVWSCLLEINFFRKFVMCICAIEVKMVKEMLFVLYP